jgi:hypothetical protein
VLDFKEYIFQMQNYLHQTHDTTVLITFFNHILLADDLPLAVADFGEEIGLGSTFGA